MGWFVVVCAFSDDILTSDYFSFKKMHYASYEYILYCNQAAMDKELYYIFIA